MPTGHSFSRTSQYLRDYWQAQSRASGAGDTKGQIDPQINSALHSHFQEAFGKHLQAIVLYGSYLRGHTDSLLDAYLIVDRYQGLPFPAWHGALGRALPPNVYQTEVPCNQASRGSLRVKYAVVTTSQFESRIRDGFHSYFWARFAQPTLALGQRDADLDHIANCCAMAGGRMLQATVPLLPTEFAGDELWHRALAQTYACELRAEGPERARDLVARDAHFYSGYTTALAQDLSWFNPATTAGRFRAVPTRTRPICQRRWRRRRWLGKALSFARLAKASLTFNDGLDYLLWKIERHSGVRVQASDRQRRFPLLFAWPLVWRLYRLGAFR